MKFKNVLFITILIFLSFRVISQNITLVPVVDERTELLSIVFRLSGAKEYVNNSIKDYAVFIDNYFTKYKEDKVIFYAKKLRKENSVSYDAVMSMAIHLELNNGIFKLKENIETQSLDKRWGDNAREFIILLNDFYKKTNFHTFFLENKPIYEIAETRFSEIITNIDLNWFEKYYGAKPKGTFNLRISLTNGGMSYGPKIINNNGNEDMYAIIGAYETDSIGRPLCPQDFSETVIHEFNHSFCNNLIDRFYPEMKIVADNFYKLVEDKMKSQAYSSSKTMLYELLVRASVIKYLQEHGVSEIKINQMISTEQSDGFIWIDQLVVALSTYENSRRENPTLEKFMPEIVVLQNSLSPKELFKNMDIKRPQISSFSIKNNSQDVDPTIKELIITFDRPMYTSAYGVSLGKCGENCYPKITSIKWNPDKNNELIITLELEPDKHYSIMFPAPFMVDASGFIMKETYSLDFKTK